MKFSLIFFLIAIVGCAKPSVYQAEESLSCYESDSFDCKPVVKKVGQIKFIVEPNIMDCPVSVNIFQGERLRSLNSGEEYVASVPVGSYFVIVKEDSRCGSGQASKRIIIRADIIPTLRIVRTLNRNIGLLYAD